MTTNEDVLLNRVAATDLLSRLAAADRCMMAMIYQIELPEDWGNRPVTYTTIGEYVGQKFEGKSLAESTIRYRHDEIVKMLRGERGEIRRSKRRSRRASRTDA